MPITPIERDANGFTFTGFTAGPADPNSAPRALLCHGWPQFASCWEPVATRLAAAGVTVAAFDQRGYSSGARPQQLSDYASGPLVNDVLGLADALGWDTFHLVGHDWGAMIGWLAAGLHPDRISSYTALSVPHGLALQQALKRDPDQYQKSGYIRAIRRSPAAAEQYLLAHEGEKLARIYGDLDPDTVHRYVQRMVAPGVLAATLKWYRAIGLQPLAPVEPVTVPTTFVWGGRDVALGRTAAEATVDFVNGPYRFLELPEAGHWLPEQHPDVVAKEILFRIG